MAGGERNACDTVLLYGTVGCTKFKAVMFDQVHACSHDAATPKLQVMAGESVEALAASTLPNGLGDALQLRLSLRQDMLVGG